MLDKIEVGKIYRWEQEFFFVVKVDIWSDMILYRTLGSSMPERHAPYNSYRRIFEYVS